MQKDYRKSTTDSKAKATPKTSSGKSRVNQGSRLHLSRRDMLFLAGGAMVVSASMAAPAMLSTDLQQMVGRLVPTLGQEAGVNWFLFDNTDRQYLTELQRRELLRLILEKEKARYATGTKMVVGTFTANLFAPVSIHFEEVSPGNAEAARAISQTGATLEEDWRRYEPGFAAAVNRGLTAAPKPEATHLFPALERALEHGRRATEPEGLVTIKLISDLMPHDPAGMSAYVSEADARHPRNAIPKLTQDPFPGPTRIEIIALRRDGRRTRTGRDLGQIQRSIAPLIVEYLKARGADIELSWV